MRFRVQKAALKGCSRPEANLGSGLSLTKLGLEKNMANSIMRCIGTEGNPYEFIMILKSLKEYDKTTF